VAQVLVNTPRLRGGIIVNTPSGTTYSYSPNSSIAVEAEDVAYLLGLGFMPSQPLQVVAAPAAPFVPAVGSATIVATGGEAVEVYPALSIVNVGLVQNPPEASESLFIDLINPSDTIAPGVHGTTFEIAAGDSFRCPPNTLSTTVNAVTSGHTFTAISM
jgi:hypothetical protein